MVTTSSASPRLPAFGGLAVALGGVVRSDAMPTDTEAKLRRAKDRLYVMGQTIGWGGLSAIQLFYQRAFDAGRETQLHDSAVVVMVMLMGMFISHVARGHVHRHGWQQLSWAPLVPRVLLLSFIMSVAWSAAGFGYIYGVLREPWPGKLGPVLTISLSTINGTLLYTGWFAFYFIYHAFERVRHMQVEQLRLVANVKEAELRALKSQVNPHFLFNSLNSLRALIDEDAPRAREVVTRLANMLRYSLQSGQQETVALDEEIRIVEDYLALEQIRHESRLQVRWEIADDATLRSRPIPPMLLQTLVENAVKYGISPRREGGEIVISAAINDGALQLRVTNPGDLSAPANAAAARAGSSTGVGLRNAADRLKLLFGGRATLALLSEPAGCVTADVRIPLPAAPR